MTSSSLSGRREVVLPWTLTDPQSQVFNDRSRYLVLVAGRRFGKTVLSATWLVSELMRSPPGALGYYVAPYRVMAKQIAWDMLKLATKDLRGGPVNAGELTIPLLGGRRIALKGADDPETLEGVGLHAVVLDEFARMKLDAWQKSIRPALSDHGGRALFCGKPRGHNHLKEFYERGQSGATHVNDWRSWLFRTVDGGHVPTEDVAEARSTLPASVYRQEYEATFELAAGRVYDAFSRRTHVVPHDEIERRFKVGGRWQFSRAVVGLDWGFVDPMVALCVGRTSTGQLVVFREEYASGRLLDESGWFPVLRSIRADCNPSGFTADPSEPGNIMAVRKMLSGSPVVYNADNARAEGVRRVQVAMLPRSNGARQEPGLIISDRCPNVIREAESYVYREIKGAPTEDPADGNDHAMDALRYAVMALTNS